MNISVELFAVRPGESNPCSVRSMVVQVPWSGTCPPFRANKLRSLPATQDSPLG